jgi:hypothetical protein
LSGGTVSRSGNDIVGNTGVAADNQVAVFDGATGKFIRTSGKDFASLVVSATGGVSGKLPAFNAAANNLVDSGVTAANVVSNTGVATDNQVAVFDGATGKFIRTSGKDFTALVVSATGGVNGNIPAFSAAANNGV